MDVYYFNPGILYQDKINNIYAASVLRAAEWRLLWIIF